MLTATADVRVRRATADDASALDALRARAGEPPGEARLRVAAERLEGTRTWIATRGSAVLAATGVVPLESFVEGVRRRFGRWTTPLVAPELSPRARLRVALRLSTVALDEALDPEGCVVTYALLEPKAWRTAERELGFEQVDHECTLVLEPGDEPVWVDALAVDRRGVERVDRFDHQALWLHERCSSAWGASVVRDERWYRARLDAEGPFVEAHGVRDADGILRGLVVVRQRPDTLDVLDLVVPPEENGVARALFARVVAESGARTVRAAVPAWSPWFERLQGWGFRVRVGSRVLAARTAVRRYDLFWLRDRWWHQPLETGGLE